MDENFHTKPSMFGWLFPAVLKSSIFGWLLYNSFYRETDVTYNHPILDDFVHPILEVAFSFHYWMFLVINFWMKSLWYHCHPLLDVSCHQFLDENYIIPLSSTIGWFLSSIFWRKLYDAIIIHYWMFAVINFWMKILWYHYHLLLDVSCHQFLDENFVMLKIIIIMISCYAQY